MKAKPAISLGLALFLLFQGLYGVTASGRVDRVADEFEVYAQTESVWDRGTQAIPQVPAQAFFGKIGLDGQQYAPYGPASAYLALPHHALGRAAAWALGIERENVATWSEVVSGITSLASTTWAALAVLGLFVAAGALGAPPRRAALVASLLGATTLLWPAATLFYSEPQSAALLIWAVCFQLQERRVLTCGAVFALLLIKASNVILLPVLAVLAVCDPELWRAESWGEALARVTRNAAPVCFAAFLAGLVHVDWNVRRFGHPLEFGFGWYEVIRPGEEPVPFRLSELPRGLFGLLFSPGKSLLLYAPALLLVVPGVRALRRTAPAVAGAWLAALALPLLYFGAYFYWEGGYSFGPRHLTPMLPVLLLPLAFGPALKAKALKWVVVIGVGVQLFGVSVSYMEDQGMGGADGRERASPYYDRFAPESSVVPPGGSLVRYKLSYTPFIGYTRILATHLSSFAPGEGTTGLEFLPLRFARVRATRPGGEALPAWFGWAVWLAFAGALAGGVARVTWMYSRV